MGTFVLIRPAQTFYERINHAQDLNRDLDLEVAQESGQSDGALGGSTFLGGTPPSAASPLPPLAELAGHGLTPVIKHLVHVLEGVEVDPAVSGELDVLLQRFGGGSADGGAT